MLATATICSEMGGRSAAMRQGRHCTELAERLGHHQQVAHLVNLSVLTAQAPIHRQSYRAPPFGGSSSVLRPTWRVCTPRLHALKPIHLDARSWVLA